jgi:hypothetical protein
MSRQPSATYLRKSCHISFNLLHPKIKTFPKAIWGKSGRGEAASDHSKFYNGHYTPLVQPSGVVAPIQASWITSCSASSKGHRFSAVRLRSSPSRPLCWSSNTSLLRFYHDSANHCQLHHLLGYESSICSLFVSRSPYLERPSRVIRSLVKFSRVLNASLSLNFDLSLFIKTLTFF